MRPQIESELTSSDDSIRLGTLFDVIDRVSVDEEALVSIFKSMRTKKLTPLSDASSGGTSGNSGKSSARKTNHRKPNPGKTTSIQSNGSSDKQFDCFRCGGDHHTRMCKVSNPTADQTAAGKAIKEAYYKARHNKGKDTNPTGITPKTT